jgi:hypothetical protein
MVHGVSSHVVQHVMGDEFIKGIKNPRISRTRGQRDLQSGIIYFDELAKRCTY